MKNKSGLCNNRTHDPLLKKSKRPFVLLNIIFIGLLAKSSVIVRCPTSRDIPESILIKLGLMVKCHEGYKMIGRSVTLSQGQGHKII